MLLYHGSKENFEKFSFILDKIERAIRQLADKKM